MVRLHVYAPWKFFCHIRKLSISWTRETPKQPPNPFIYTEALEEISFWIVRKISGGDVLMAFENGYRDADTSTIIKVGGRN